MIDRFDHLFVLGWKLVSSWGRKDEPRGACLSSEAMSIVLAEPHRAEDKSKTHGINGTGTRWFVVKDPDGNLIAFEQDANAR